MTNTIKSWYQKLVKIFDPTVIYIPFIVLLAFTPLRLFALFFLIFGFSRLFGFIKNIGPLTQLILGWLLVVAITAIIALLAWIIHTPLSSSAILVLLSVLYLIILRFTPAIKKPTQNRNAVFDDIVSAALAVVVCFILFMPFIQNPSPSTIGRLVLFNGDNSTHIEIMKANDLNRGNAYGMNNRVNSFVDTASYPQGWHFFTAFIKWLVEPLVNFNNSPGKILLLFYVVSLVWFGVLCFLITKISIWLGRQLSRDEKTFIPAYGTLVIVLPVLFGLVFTLFSYGFETQISALVFLLAEILILSYYLARSPSKDLTALRLALVFASTVAFMWIFLAPVSVLVVIVVYALTALSQRKIPWKDVSLAVFLGLLVLLQFSFRILFPLTLEASESFINSNGLVAESNFVILALISVVVLYIWLVRRTAVLMPAVITLVLGSVFSGIILWYQYATIGEPRYFFYKANFTLIILATIVGGALAFWLVKYVVRNWPKTAFVNRASLAVLLLASAIIISFQVQTPLVAKYFNQTAFGVEERQADAIMNIISNRPAVGYRLIAIGSCDRANDIRTTQLAWLSTFKPLPREGLFEPMRMFIHDENILFEKIKNHQAKYSSKPIILVNDTAVGERFRISTGNNAANFEIINIDTDNVSQTASECPDRIRPVNSN